LEKFSEGGRAGLLEEAEEFVECRVEEM